MFFLTLVMALREVRRNTLRSILTGLGIVIGVAAVILMVNLGQSATAKVTADIRNFGNNMLTVIPGAQRRGVTSEQASMFTREDAEAVKKQIPNALHVAPASSRGALVVFGNKNYSTSVQGSTLEFFAIRSLAIGKGRNFTETEIATGVPSCVLGTTVVKELFGAGDPLGAKGESEAEKFLVARGYQVIGRNLRFRRGEIDLLCIAPDERTVVLVEVKSRAQSRGVYRPEAAITSRKRRTLHALAKVAP